MPFMIAFIIYTTVGLFFAATHVDTEGGSDRTDRWMFAVLWPLLVGFWIISVAAAIFMSVADLVSSLALKFFRRNKREK